jgi:hypothetical protein
MSKIKGNFKKYATKRTIIPFIVSCMLTPGFLFFSFNRKITGIIEIDPTIWFVLFVISYLMLATIISVIVYYKKYDLQIETEKYSQFSLELFFGFLLGFLPTLIITFFFGLINVGIYLLFPVEHKIISALFSFYF